MKYILLGIIKVYQIIPGPWHSNCKHIPSCSNYAIEAIIIYGSFKGIKLSIKRILKCNPWNTGGYDPVIKESKNEKNN